MPQLPTSQFFFLSTLNEWLLLTNYLLVRADQNTNYSCKRPHYVIVFVRAFCLVFTFLDLWLPWSVSHSVLYLFRMLGLILHFICLGLGSSKSVEVYCSSSVFQSQPSFAALLRLFIFFLCVSIRLSLMVKINRARKDICDNSGISISEGCNYHLIIGP